MSFNIDDKSKLMFMNACRKKGTNATRVLNGFMKQFSNPDKLSLDDFDSSPNLMSDNDVWRKYYSHFTNAEDMIVFAKKINFIVEHHKQVWDELNV